MEAEDVMDYVLQANEGLVSAINRYEHSQIDFALFAFYECLTYLKRYDRHEKDLIKKTVINGELKTGFIKYEEPAEVEEVPYKEIDPIQLKELLLKIPIKDRDANIYLYYILQEKDYGAFMETSKYFKLTSERIRQIVTSIEKKIRADKNISREIINLMN
jgi:DNA-directed RNA polymerase sigma subunit (sigma70/sigma32)